jgi:hypothetical protein
VRSDGGNGSGTLQNVGVVGCDGFDEVRHDWFLCWLVDVEVCL